MFTVGTAQTSVQRGNFITIINDMVDEQDESFTVTFEPLDTGLGDSNNFMIGTISVTTVTIRDDDGKLILTRVKAEVLSQFKMLYFDD